ncbi:MAG: hypothetical protein IPL90_17900 [Holophagales bacterium]|nr:hypothetical protein [Holophagales bacterium]
MRLPGIPSPEHPWRLALAALCALFLLANAPLLIGLDAPNWDASSFFGPAFTLVADHARAGRLLLWNPFVDGGAPDAAQPEYGVFSPLTVGAGALFGGTERGFCFYWLGVWGLGGLGFLGLARHLGAPPWAGFVVTLGYLFSGTFTGHAQHTSWLHSYAFVPWVIWRLDVALLDRRLLPAVQAGALLGLSALAGYPAIVIQTGVLAFFWAMGREWTREGGGEEPRRGSLGFSAGVLAIVAVVGAVVLLPSWFAFLRESRGYSDRSGPLPKEVAVHDNALHPLALTTTASPYLHVLATVYAPARWAPTDGSSAGAYAGVAIPAFAVFALCRAPRRRWLWWLAGTALLLLATSTDALPLRGWLYDVLPWERFARHGAQRKDLALFVLAVLALHGAPRAEGAARRPALLRVCRGHGSRRPGRGGRWKRHARCGGAEAGVCRRPFRRRLGKPRRRRLARAEGSADRRETRRGRSRGPHRSRGARRRRNGAALPRPRGGPRAGPRGLGPDRAGEDATARPDGGRAPPGGRPACLDLSEAEQPERTAQATGLRELHGVDEPVPGRDERRASPGRHGRRGGEGVVRDDGDRRAARRSRVPVSGGGEQGRGRRDTGGSSASGDDGPLPGGDVVRARSGDSRLRASTPAAEPSPSPFTATCPTSWSCRSSRRRRAGSS